MFVNYRRDDERSAAARVRDRLAAAFGGSNVFMDVDNLTAGQRFDKELEKALSQTDIFLAVIGPRWMELFTQRQALSERDYVRDEIAQALKRGIVVIPVLIESATLPRGDDLPEDIRELVLHQKHSIAHEQFGRDVDSLIDAIRLSLQASQPSIAWLKPRGSTIALMAAVAAAAVGIHWLAAYTIEVKSGVEREVKLKSDEPEHQRKNEASLKAEEEKHQAATRAKPTDAPKNEGWVFLASQSLGFIGSESETVAVGKIRGTFEAIRLTVKDRSVTLSELRIVYGNGEEDVIPIKTKIEAGTSYGPIVLKGGPRTVTEVQTRGRSRITDNGAGGKGRATLEIWGQH